MTGKGQDECEGASYLSFIAFPLRLRNGLLKRCGEPEAIVALIQTMARTPGGSWSGSSDFGLRDLLEDVRRRPSLVAILVAKLNLALTDLGVTNFRVAAMEREAPSSRDVDSYVLTLVPVAGGEGLVFGLNS